MYQNFDEKYVSINFDDGSSATVTQTTLAYWDQEYGKNALTSDEQLNMYIKPKVSPAIKYLMLDNMKKLVDANAFVNVKKEADPLGNIRYNFYTKRNVRYTIVFESGYNEINGKYLNEFEELYNKQSKTLEEKEKEEPINSEKTTTIEKISFDDKKNKKQISDFLNNANIEIIDEIESDNKEENIEKNESKVNVEDGLSFQQDRIPKSKVIINETDDIIKKDVDIENLENILEDLDL